MNASNLSLYHVFLTIAESKSISEAADKLFISQPAVSKSLQKLENSLGVILITRNSRGINLTREGEIFYNYLKNAFETIDTGEHILKKLTNLDMGHIRIGVISSLCNNILLPCLKDFLPQHPNIQFSIDCMPSSRSLRLIEKKEMDLVLITEPEDTSKLNIIYAGQLDYTFIITPEYINILKQRIPKFNYNSFTDDLLNPDNNELHAYILSKANLVLLGRNNMTRRYIDKYIEEYNIKIDADNAIEVNNLELLVDFIKTGLGIGIVIKQFIQKELDTGTLIELPLPFSIPSKKICFAYSNMYEPGIAVKALIHFIEGLYNA